MNIDPFFDECTSTLTYLVWDEKTRDAVVVDPVLDFDPHAGRLWTESVDKVAAAIDREKLNLHLVLETHVHADHLSGSQALAQRFHAKIAVSHRITEVQLAFRKVFGFQENSADGWPFDRLLQNDETIQAGSLTFTALPTPGHTPACMSFQFGSHVLTGDALFLDDVGVGRCDFPGGDAGTLYQSVTRRLFTLPSDTVLYVGHDYPPSGRSWRTSTTVGAARRANAQLNVDITETDFVARRTARDRTLAPPRLLYPSLQVNIEAGRLPEPEANGQRYLKIPLSGM
jgi:glyoxylase-like metal-dependent hydrolase (beta-lactamase superfamily II)